MKIKRHSGQLSLLAEHPLAKHSIPSTWCVYCNTNLRKERALIISHLRENHPTIVAGDAVITIVMDNSNHRRLPPEKKNSFGALQVTTVGASKPKQRKDSYKKCFQQISAQLCDRHSRSSGEIKKLLRSIELDFALFFAIDQYENYRNLDPLFQLLSGFKETSAYEPLHAWICDRYSFDSRVPDCRVLKFELKRRPIGAVNGPRFYSYLMEKFPEGRRKSKKYDDTGDKEGDKGWGRVVGEARRKKTDTLQIPSRKSERS